MAICKECGGEFAQQYMHGEICTECWYFSYLPSDYKVKEEYEYDAIWGHENATEKPPVGVGWLEAMPTYAERAKA